MYTKDQMDSFRIKGSVMFGQGSYGSQCFVCGESDYWGPIIHKDGCDRVTEEIMKLRGITPP